MRRQSWSLYFGILLSTAVIPRAEAGFTNWETPHVNPLAITPDGSRLLAVNTPDNRLEVFDITGGLPVPLGSIPVGLDPVSVAARTDSEAWVVNHISDSISIVDLTAMHVVATIRTGDEPTDVVFAGNPPRAFVSLSQENRVAVYDPAVVDADPVLLPIEGEDPRALATDGTRVFVAIFESGNATTIVAEGAAEVYGTNPPPNFGTGFDPPMNPALPVPPAVSQILRRNELGQWIDDNAHDWSDFVTWDVHDHDVAIIDADALTVSYASGLMNLNMNLAVQPSGRVTVIGTEATNEIRFAPIINGTFIRVELASFDPADPFDREIVDLNSHLDYIGATVSQPVRDLSIGDPRDIVWNAAGDRGYVGGMGSNNVLVIDASASALARVEVGEGPTGLALDEPRSRLYVLNKFAASITAVDTTLLAVASETPFFDPTPSAIRLGRPHLYDTHRTSGLGQASCASCHVDGRMDQLAWDLGNPAGEMDEACAPISAPDSGILCVPAHPMKGPMTTQTLQGTIGNEPFHWRGEKDDLAAFNVAYEELQGDDAQLSESEMAELEAFVASITFPPNPYRNIDNSLPLTLAGGDVFNGRHLFRTSTTLMVVQAACSSCHGAPIGTLLAIGSDNTLTPAEIMLDSQTFKVAHLRNLYEKTGFDATSTANNRGFGFLHDGRIDTLDNFLRTAGHDITIINGDNPATDQMILDLVAYQLTLGSDTHAGVGQQLTLDGVNDDDPAIVELLTVMRQIADDEEAGLIAKSRMGGLPRGYAYLGGDMFQADRLAEQISYDNLRQSAAAESELTFTLVPLGEQARMGIDRDADGYFDGDELDASSNPADPSNIPTIAGDADLDGDADGDDFAALVECFLGPSTPPLGLACPVFDADADLNVDLPDVAAFASQFTGPGGP